MLTMTAKPASPKQINWIRDMLAERPNWYDLLNGQTYETAFDILGNVNNPDPKFVAMHEARTLIDTLLKMKATKPSKSSSVTPSPFTRLQALLKNVKPGYYALPREDGTDTFDFFRVVEIEKGQWAGKRFVNRLVGAPGSWDRVKPTMPQQLEITRKIAVDVDESAKLYAAKHRRCCRCNADLSHPRSQVALIGEKCAGIWGWAW
jgi:hypothetical protein